MTHARNFPPLFDIVDIALRDARGSRCLPPVAEESLLRGTDPSAWRLVAAPGSTPRMEYSRGKCGTTARRVAERRACGRAAGLDDAERHGAPDRQLPGAQAPDRAARAGNKPPGR